MDENVKSKIPDAEASTNNKDSGPSKELLLFSSLTVSTISPKMSFDQVKKKRVVIDYQMKLTISPVQVALIVFVTPLILTLYCLKMRREEKKKPVTPATGTSH